MVITPARRKFIVPMQKSHRHKPMTLISQVCSVLFLQESFLKSVLAASIGQNFRAVDVELFIH
jgi:hypothetical protein